MIAKLIQTVKEEKNFIASLIENSTGLSKKDKILSKYGLSEKQIEYCKYDEKINKHLNCFCEKKITENTIEEKNFMAAWEKLSFARRNLLVQKLENLGEKELSQKLSEKIVMFSDILKLPDSVIKTLLEKIDYGVLKRSLCDISGDYFFTEMQEKIKEKFYANLEMSKVELLKEDLYFMGPVRKVDILEARKNICGILESLVI